MSSVIIKDIPEYLYRRFKEHCKEEGMTVKGAVIKLIKKEIEKENKEK